MLYIVEHGKGLLYIVRHGTMLELARNIQRLTAGAAIAPIGAGRLFPGTAGTAGTAVLVAASTPFAISVHGPVAGLTQRVKVQTVRAVEDMQVVVDAPGEGRGITVVAVESAALFASYA